MPRGYRSATEYCFREDQADAIVRVTAYHREDYCRSVIWFSPREHVAIRPSIATPFQRIASTSLGSLDRLLLELLHDVLLRLDMSSIFNFRQVNLGSRRLVDSLKQYQMVGLHGLSLLCALLRTRLSKAVSLFDFYAVLCTQACTFCGKFGGFVSLLTWNRCCFSCLRRPPETRVQTLAAVQKQFHLTKAQIGQIRSFETFPGMYWPSEAVYPYHATVVSVHQAILLSGQQPQTLVQVQAQPANSGRSSIFNLMGSCPLPYHDRRTGRVEYGLSCAGCYFAPTSGIFSSGGEAWAFEARDKVYAQDGLLEHFRWCEPAQLLWELSDQGPHKPTEPPEGVRRTGFFNKGEGPGWRHCLPASCEQAVQNVS